MRRGWMVGLAAALGLIGMTGCALVKQTGLLSPDRVQALTKLAVYVGARADLVANPDHRPAYETANTALKQLVQLQKWDAVALAAVLQGLPIKEFSVAEGKLVFTGAVMLVDALGLGAYDARQVEHVAAVVCGAAGGMELALAMESTYTKGLQPPAIDPLPALRAQERATRGRR